MKKRLFGVVFALTVCCLVVSAISIASRMDILEFYVPESISAGRAHWLEGWQYRKSHNITGSAAGVQLNYPMIINVHYDNGVDFGEDVYLHFKCRRDFGDIRFTDFQGDTLDYWIQQKTDGVRALTWVEINYIPIDPDYTTIYIYYGNPNATTTSNKDWVHSFATDFEDATNQGWLVSWTSHVTSDGVSSSSFQGNSSREAGRAYGRNTCGTGEFLEKIQTTVYLASGSYRVEVAARQVRYNEAVVPREVMLMIDGVVVDQASAPSTAWHWLTGNFTVTTDHYVEFVVAFRVSIGYVWSAIQAYSIDSAFVRKWCDPEPIHDTWGMEKGDNTPP